MKIPECCWVKPINYKVRKEPKTSMLALRTLFKMRKTIAGVIKYAIKYSIKERRRVGPGEFVGSAIKTSSIQGVSIGGMGAGTIGRSYMGDFRRWQLYPNGKKVEKTIYANQFSIRINDNQRTFSNVLYPGSPKKGLKSWNWNFPGPWGTYHALYPRAWTTYKIPGFEANITCKQITPFIPNNYKESSYPTGIFEWEFENIGDKELEFSVMLTWQNDDVAKKKKNAPAGNYNSYDKIGINRNRILHGIKMNHVTPENENGPVSFFIGTLETDRVEVTHHTSFDTGKDGKEIWVPFSESGKLSNDSKSYKTTKGQHTGGAICATFKVAPRTSKIIPFVISWDIPIVTFGSKKTGRQWYKRYTKFFGTDGQQVVNIAKKALLNYKDWDKQIDKWQKPIVKDDSLPNWFKLALFNELYYLADGGTHWTAGEVNPEPNKIGYIDDDLGHFGYLECFDYLMTNTYDVHSYASFALALLFPKIQKSISRDFARCVVYEDKTLKPTILDPKPVVNKPMNVCPHDIGGPRVDPWFKLNYYSLHDPAVWKDLNSEFVIQMYFEYILDPDDKDFIKLAWPSVVGALKFLEQFDLDGDGVIENSGSPEQTYDTWTMKGVSAYCAGLWLTANAAAARLAKLVGDSKREQKYRERTKKIKEVYEQKLWNGEYYRFDEHQKDPSVIMSDQLCGQWWARNLGLDEALLPENHVKSAYKKIFDFNVMKFGAGDMGAVNGMMPSGKIDQRSMQSRECWTGTSYGLASGMLWEGMDEEAFKTAHGVYNVTYEHGYAFRTPEAYDVNLKYRASQYMRPLAIWGVYYALKNRHAIAKRKK